MDYTLQIVVTVFVIVAALALLLQLGTLFAMFLMVKKLQTQILHVWPQVEAIIGITKRTTENVEKHVAKIGDSSTAILEVTRQQVNKIDEFLNDATTRAKVQIERAEIAVAEAGRDRVCWRSVPSARLSAFSTGLKAQRSTQKMSSCAMKSRASSIGRPVRPKGPAAVHRSFQADQ